jgi:3-isopropylmalate dehydrogenase
MPDKNREHKPCQAASAVDDARPADDADVLETAVAAALAAGARTADIAEAGAARLSTAQMGDAVLTALEKVAGKQKESA